MRDATRGETGMDGMWGAATKKVIGADVDDPRFVPTSPPSDPVAAPERIVVARWLARTTTGSYAVGSMEVMPLTPPRDAPLADCFPGRLRSRGNGVAAGLVVGGGGVVGSCVGMRCIHAVPAWIGGSRIRVDPLGTSSRSEWHAFALSQPDRRGRGKPKRLHLLGTWLGRFFSDHRRLLAGGRGAGRTCLGELWGRQPTWPGCKTGTRRNAVHFTGWFSLWL